jgi:glycerol kinase
VEDDSLNGADPLADNAIVWRDRRGAKVIKAATPQALVYMLADSTVYQGK